MWLFLFWLVSNYSFKKEKKRRKKIIFMDKRARRTLQRRLAPFRGFRSLVQRRCTVSSPSPDHHTLNLPLPTTLLVRQA